MSAISQKPSSEGQNRGPGLLVIAFLLTFIASIVVTLRVYIRIWVKHTLGWDDGFVIFSLLLTIASIACNVPAVIAGYGQHVQYLSHHQLIEVAKWTYIATPLFFLSLTTSKISICILLLRVLKQTQAKLKPYFLYAVIAIITITAVPSAGYSLGQCQPVSKWWNPTAPGHCYDSQIYVKVAYANGSINAICDFILALFPITFIKDLHLPNHKKILLGLLMSCGVVCGSIAIARTVLNGELNAHSDTSYTIIKSTILVIVEENISIIVACVPTLGPFFEFFSDKVKSLKSRRHHTQLKETAPSLKKGDPIPLRSNTDPIRPVTDYESSAEPLGKSCQGIYGSQIGLVHGIQRTTRVDVLRGDKPV